MSRTSDNVFALHADIVRAMGFDQEKWRRFHIECYKRILEDFPDERQRNGIFLATGSVEGGVTSGLYNLILLSETEVNRSWKVVESFLNQNDKEKAIWPISEVVDAAWCDYLGWNCVQLACTRTLDPFSTPEPAAALRAWKWARLKCIEANQDMSRSNIERIWQEIHNQEEAAHLSLFRSIYGLEERAV